MLLLTDSWTPAACHLAAAAAALRLGLASSLSRSLLQLDLEVKEAFDTGLQQHQEGSTKLSKRTPCE